MAPRGRRARPFPVSRRATDGRRDQRILADSDIEIDRGGRARAPFPRVLARRHPRGSLFTPVRVPRQAGHAMLLVFIRCEMFFFFFDNPIVFRRRRPCPNTSRRDPRVTP